MVARDGERVLRCIVAAVVAAVCTIAQQYRVYW